MADDFNLDDEDSFDDPTSGVNDPNTNFTKVREYAKKQEKAAKKANKELEDLRVQLAEFQTQQVKSAAKNAAKQHGLNDAQVETILALKPDATPEQIESMAVAFGMKKDQPEPTEGSVGAPPIVPTPITGSQLPTSEIKWDEFMYMARNPASRDRAIDLFTRGLVRDNDGNPLRKTASWDPQTGKGVWDTNRLNVPSGYPEPVLD